MISKTVHVFRCRILLFLAYLSVAVISSQGSVLTFDIPVSGILVFIALIIVDFLILATKNKVYISPVVYMIVARYVLFAINYFVQGLESVAIYEITALTLVGSISIIYFSNFADDDLTNVRTVVSAVSLVTAIQIVLNVVLSGFDLDKDNITAGVGHSNYVAAILVVCVGFLLMRNSAKKYIDWIIVGLSVFALLLTQSLGGYVALLVVIVYYIVKRVNLKKVNNVIKLLLVVSVFCFAMFIFSKTELGEPIYEMIVRKLSLLKDGDIMRLGSSRFALYEFSWDNIKRNLLFGTIDNYNPYLSADYGWQNFKTHNFILESLLLFGIVGTLINVAIILYVLRGLKKVGLDLELKQSVFVVFLATIVHGLIEPNLFTIRFEVFFAMFVGVALSHRKQTNSFDQSHIKGEEK